MYYKIKTNGLSIKTILKNKDDYFLKFVDEDKKLILQKEENIKEEENIQEENNNNNLEEGFKRREFKEREIELMRNLYSEISTLIYPFVVEILGEYEFIGSPLYSPLGIDRETISQIIDKVINLAEKTLDVIEEIRLDKTEDSVKRWGSWALLRTVIEVLVLNDLFLIKRPDYFKKFATILK